MSDTYYITTPIYYVNDMPHVGHIYTTVMADVFARYQRMSGRRVYFLTGTDEHGQNVERAARRQGITPQELADRVVGRYHELWKTLSITHDDFIRTTDPRHHVGVEALIRRIAADDDLEMASHGGWYCASCEGFYTEKEIGDAKLCPTHDKPVEWHEEENLFFKLSRYQDRLLEWYRANPGCIQPESRYNEVVRFVEGGLKDLSVSRVSLRWGVPFPDHPDHVVYVWLDALSNYISALGFGSDDAGLYDTFWPATVHLVGKDILRFHCVYWPAFLMSAGLPLPETVFGHGWWMADEKKMSKSLGNVVRPEYLIVRFGADALRYFLAREMTFGQDSSFSDRAFLERYNSDLANALGNAASRVTVMTRRSLDGRVPPPPAEGPLPAAAAETVTAYRHHMEAFEPHRALESVWALLADLDGYLQEQQPWKLAKDEAARPRLEAVLGSALETLRITSILIEPVMPTTAAALRTQLGADDLPADLDRGTAWSLRSGDGTLGDAGPLFPRVDVDTTMKELAMRDDAPKADTPAEAPADDRISIEKFFETQLKIGLVVEAERVPNSKKLMRIMVDLGEGPPRQLVAGIAERYAADDLVGRRIVVVANLKPAKLMGVESQGMLLAASVDGDPYLLFPDGDPPPGTPVR